MQPACYLARLRVASGWDWRNSAAGCEPLRSWALTVEFRVELPEHVDVFGSLELFRRSGDDLIDRWDGQRLIRAVPVGGARWVPFVARAVAGSPAAIDVSVPRAAD